MMCVVFHVSFFSLNYKTKQCDMQRLLINRLMKHKTYTFHVFYALYPRNTIQAKCL